MALSKINAGIDETNTVRVSADIIGSHETIREYGCVFDSGFTGDLALPIEQVAKIGLTTGGVITVELADGSLMDAQLFMCQVKIGDITQDASTIVMGNDILVGMGLMAPFDICLRSATSEALIEPQPAYANFAGVLHRLSR